MLREILPKGRGFPSRGTRLSWTKPAKKLFLCYNIAADSGWALNSAVECHLHTVEVIGSNPIAPTSNQLVLLRLSRFGGQLISLATSLGRARSIRRRVLSRNFRRTTGFISEVRWKLGVTKPSDNDLGPCRKPQEF